MKKLGAFLLKQYGVPFETVSSQENEEKPFDAAPPDAEAALFAEMCNQCNTDDDDDNDSDYIPEEDSYEEEDDDEPEPEPEPEPEDTHQEPETRQSGARPAIATSVTIPRAGVLALVDW